MTEHEFKKTLALTSDGDLAVDETKRAYFRTDKESAVQQLKIRLLTIQGEDPFEPNRGLRLFGVAAAPNPILEREIRFTLSSHPWVESVEMVDIEEVEGEPRSREVMVGVQLIDGEEAGFEVNFNE